MTVIIAKILKRLKLVAMRANLSSEKQVMDNELFFKIFGPQIGEVAFHTFTRDPHVVSQSFKDFEVIRKIIAQRFKKNSNLKILELCPNNQIASYLLKKEFKSENFVLDISQHALLDGQKIANEQGLEERVEMYVSDYHELPFEANTFDFVFIFRAIHHTKTPEVVLKEVARILKSGGIFSLNEEPVKRELCSFSFLTNRLELISGYERFLHDKGVLGLLSYPTCGSRPEFLFHMTENGEIEKSFYLTQSQQFFNIDSFKFTEPSLTDFETKWLITNQHLINYKEELRKELSAIFESSKACFDVKAKLMGLTLAGEKEVSLLVEKIDELKNKLRDSNVETLAENFGVGISAIYTKKEDLYFSDILDLALKRDADSGIYFKKLKNEAFTVDFDKPMLPEIQENNRDRLVQIFNSSDWEIIKDAGEVISIYPKNSSGIINCLNSEDALLILRFYGVELEKPYSVILRDKDDNLIDEVIVCKSETRFIRYRGRISGTIKLNLSFLDGAPVKEFAIIRIGVLQIFLGKFNVN
jgi:ubiquinone/menaquinone biosynthesis C-methylase UbiE